MSSSSIFLRRASILTRTFTLVAGAAVLLLGGSRLAQAETFNKTSGDNFWNITGNWVEGTFPNLAGAIALFNSDQTTTRNVFLGQNITIGSISITNSTNFQNAIGEVDGIPTLTFNADGAGPARATLSVTGNSFNVTNPNAIRGPVVLADDLTITVDATDLSLSTSPVPVGTLTFFGSGQSITGSGGITKEGLGSMNFADTTKAYTGPTIINAGRIRFNSAGRLSGTSAVTVNAGAALTIDAGGAAAGTADYTFGNVATTILTLNGAGLGASSPLGYFPGAIRKENARPASIGNTVFLQSDSAINVANAAVAGDGTSGLTLTGSVIGAGKLTLGALPGDLSIQPRLTLTGNNSYLGGTTSSFGTLVVSGLGDLGLGDVFVDGTTTLQVGLTLYTANGRLELQTSTAIDDLSKLLITGTDLPLGFRGGPNQGGFVILAPGVNEIVGALELGGVPQVPGTYGSTSSAATFRDDEYFSGAGIVTVVPEPASVAMLLGGFGALLGLQRFRRRH